MNPMLPMIASFKCENCLAYYCRECYQVERKGAECIACVAKEVTDQRKQRGVNSTRNEAVLQVQLGGELKEMTILERMRAKIVEAAKSAGRGLRRFTTNSYIRFWKKSWNCLFLISQL